MHRLALVLMVLAFTLAACSGDKGLSRGNDGSTSTQTLTTGGTPGGDGGGLGANAEAGPDGTAGTGGATGAGGAVDAPSATDVAAGSGGDSDGSTSTQPLATGGTPGGGGPSTNADAASAGTAGTGGAAGAGGAVDAPSSTDVAAGTGGGSGGTAPSGGAGGAIIKLDAAAGGQAGSGLDAGTAGSVGCDKDLSGTWDLFATSVGTGIVRGVLIVSKDGFSLSTSRAQLTYNAQTPSATWQYTPPYHSSSTRVISVQSTPAAANTGSFPVAVGGHWVLQSATETCTLDVAADRIAGHCTGLPGDHNLAGVDWPYEVLPSPENGFNYTVTRSDALASQFGDFGGNWAAGSDSGSAQGCSIKLEGNTASTSCHTSNRFNGDLHLTVGANCVASGVTPRGLEVSARRR